MKTIEALYPPETQEDVTGAATPAPANCTSTPVSHAPLTVTDEVTSLLAVGDVIETAGATVSLVTVKELLPSFPALSV